MTAQTVIDQIRTFVLLNTDVDQDVIDRMTNGEYYLSDFDVDHMIDVSARRRANAPLVAILTNAEDESRDNVRPDNVVSIAIAEYNRMVRHAAAHPVRSTSRSQALIEQATLALQVQMLERLEALNTLAK